MRPEYFIQKTKKGGKQVFLMFDRRLITKQGWGENIGSLQGKQWYFKIGKGSP